MFCLHVMIATIMLKMLVKHDALNTVILCISLYIFFVCNYLISWSSLFSFEMEIFVLYQYLVLLIQNNKF